MRDTNFSELQVSSFERLINNNDTILINIHTKDEWMAMELRYE